MTYDKKCAELARAFLHDEGLDTEENVDALAKAIQSTIEDHLEYDESIREQRLARRRGA